MRHVGVAMGIALVQAQVVGGVGVVEIFLLSDLKAEQISAKRTTESVNTSRRQTNIPKTIIKATKMMVSQASHYRKELDPADGRSPAL